MKLIESKSRNKKINYNLIILVTIIVYLLYANKQMKSTLNKVNFAIGLAEEAQSAAESAQYAAENAFNTAQNAQDYAEDALYYSRKRY